MANDKPDKPPPEIARLMPAIDSSLAEYVDAYVLFAISTDGRPILLNRVGCEVHGLALRAMLADYVMGRT